MNPRTRRIIQSGIFISAGIVFPLIFHLLGDMGKVFLPMHVPVIAAGFFMPPLYAGLIGLFTPLLSSLITGMPPLFPIMPIMCAELLVYGVTASLLGRSAIKQTYPRLIITMTAGRIAAGLAAFVMGAGFGFKMSAWAYLKMIVIMGLPGIAAHLIVIPLLVRALRRYRQ